MKHTAQIFDLLSKGRFISQNARKNQQDKLYDYIEGHFEELRDYFSQIGFVLETGKNYYYFSRKEANADLERKLETFYRYIDLLDFFVSYDNTFGEGTRFSSSEIEQKCKVDTHLKDSLLQITKGYHDSNLPYQERIDRVLQNMTTEGFLECEDEERKDYKVLSSINYLQAIIQLIDIQEDGFDETTPE